MPQPGGQAKASAGNTCSAITLGSWPRKFSPQRHILRAFPVSQLLHWVGLQPLTFSLWRSFFTASWPPFPSLPPRFPTTYTGCKSLLLCSEDTIHPSRRTALLGRPPTLLSDFPFTFHFHALEKEMATHSSVLAWRIPGMREPGGLPSMGSHRVGHD